jgi:Na+-translocating ferredoxin:NAD+ oxidoreductase RNF subunit RnfB
MTNIIYAAIVLGGMGLIFGALLGIAGRIFKVQKDEREDEILNVLPGANCGGCGYAGCADFASNVVNGNAKTNGCPVGGNDCANKVAAIMGVAASEVERKVARVKCSGNNNSAGLKFRYYGIRDCIAASKLGGGQKLCDYGCLGLGTCQQGCKFGAIKVVDGVAKVDPDKCTACGMCVSYCPKNVIEFVPYTAKPFVTCNSKQKGADVAAVCKAGCIACGICEKNCPTKAIVITDNIAHVDPDKCTNCGVCVSKCPKKVIIR